MYISMKPCQLFLLSNTHAFDFTRVVAALDSHQQIFIIYLHYQFQKQQHCQILSQIFTTLIIMAPFGACATYQILLVPQQLIHLHFMPTMNWSHCTYVSPLPTLPWHSFWTPRRLKMKALRFFEKLGTNYSVTWYHILEEQCP